MLACFLPTELITSIKDGVSEKFNYYFAIFMISSLHCRTAINKACNIILSNPTILIEITQQFTTNFKQKHIDFIDKLHYEYQKRNALSLFGTIIDGIFALIHDFQIYQILILIHSPVICRLILCLFTIAMVINHDHFGNNIHDIHLSINKLVLPNPHCIIRVAKKCAGEHCDFVTDFHKKTCFFDIPLVWMLHPQNEQKIIDAFYGMSLLIVNEDRLDYIPLLTSIMALYPQCIVKSFQLDITSSSLAKQGELYLRRMEKHLMPFRRVVCAERLLHFEWFACAELMSWRKKNYETAKMYYLNALRCEGGWFSKIGCLTALSVNCNKNKEFLMASRIYKLVHTMWKKHAEDNPTHSNLQALILENKSMCFQKFTFS